MMTDDCFGELGPVWAFEERLSLCALCQDSQGSMEREIKYPSPD